MCLRSAPIPPVPEETARVARAAFPKGNAYLTMRDEFGSFFEDPEFAALFPHCGQPAESPWRLSLVTLLQFAEGLSDRQAAEAMRSRIDWKYLLGLELDDPGFDASVLSEFRARLVTGGAEELLFNTLLERFRARKLLKAGGRQRTDSTHVLAAVRAMNRLVGVGETLRHALNVLAVAVPDWLRQQCPAEWEERYGARFEHEGVPKQEAERQALAEAIGVDGFRLLKAVYAPTTPAWVRQLPAVEVLRQVWLQQYDREAHPQQAEERVTWRANEALPPALRCINSPYDSAARYSQKRSTQWVGYKVHLTETCDPDLPRLITDVQTTAAPLADGETTPAIQAALAARDLLPKEQLVDTGYLDAELLVSSRQDYGVELVGPTRPDYRWQARQGAGFAARDFLVNWEEQYAVCPQGKRSTKWNPVQDRSGNPVIKIGFAHRECRRCPCRDQCTRSRVARRTVTVRREAAHQALQGARQRERTEEFHQTYAARAGVEGTLSQGVRRCGLRRSRYVGQAKTHLQHLLTGAALNFVRVAEWLVGTPLAKTRTSAFSRLMLAPA